MAIYKTGEHKACTDCLSWLANADLTALDMLYPDTAEALAESIKEGERTITAKYGAVHVGSGELERSTAGCDFCCRCIGMGADLATVETYTSAKGRDGRLDARFILTARVDLLDWQKRGLSYTASGYGAKIPTRYVIDCADKRTRRVYVMQYGNSGSPYVLIKGERVFLSVDAECKIEEAK